MEEKNKSNDSSEISYILGIDYGKSKVGLAIADSETRIAFCYGTLENDRNFYKKLMTIIKKENVNMVVIGIPSYVNSEDVEYDSEKLGEYLRNIEKIEVDYCNEMFSTKMARENLKEKGIKSIGEFDDEESARIILEWWLSSGRMTKKEKRY